MPIFNENKPLATDLLNELPSLLTTNAIVFRQNVEKHSFWTDASGVSAGIPRLSDGSAGPGGAQIGWKSVIARPHCAMPQAESASAARRKACAASEYQNEWRRATARVNSFWAGGEHEVAKWTVPSFSGGVPACWWPSSARTAAVRKRTVTRREGGSFILRTSCRNIRTTRPPASTSPPPPAAPAPEPGSPAAGIRSSRRGGRTGSCRARSPGTAPCRGRSPASRRA